jgi:hypothetical protein
MPEQGRDDQQTAEQRCIAVKTKINALHTSIVGRLAGVALTLARIACAAEACRWTISAMAIMFSRGPDRAPQLSVNLSRINSEERRRQRGP